MDSGELGCLRGPSGKLTCNLWRRDRKWKENAGRTRKGGVKSHSVWANSSALLEAGACRVEGMFSHFKAWSMWVRVGVAYPQALPTVAADCCSCLERSAAARVAGCTALCPSSRAVAVCADAESLASPEQSTVRFT